VARQAGRLSELEIACRQSACRRFNEQQLPGKLFLNVSPESLLEAAHQPGRTLQLLQDFGIPPSQVVIELTEQTPIDDFQLLQTALHHYRAMGFSIALDDLGAGYSSLRLWSELRPDYVKIDRHFIDGIHQDALKREFVGSILQIAKASRAQVIAEGIELPEELAVLTEMGVDLVQGYLLGRPQEHPPRDARALMPKHDSSSVALNDEGSDLSALLNDQPAVHRDTPTATVLEAFRRQANLNSLAVLDEQGQPCGIVHRHSLSDALLKPFATDLFARKPISRLMNDDFLAVEMSQSLQQVSRLITSRARQRIEEDFIITLNGGYLGLGRVIDVLKLITELKIQQARYANPLTLLPGNVPIQQCLTRLLQQGRESVICYVDIDSFKPFNDIYGYGRGDEVLLCLAQCLNERVDRVPATSSATSAAMTSSWSSARKTGANASTSYSTTFKANAAASIGLSTWRPAASLPRIGKAFVRSFRCCRCPSAWCTCTPKPAHNSTPVSLRKWLPRRSIMRRMFRGIACM
jgi:EAL domain-containing protein (putative c-di-GMP-specific phosphodiesterase class I)/GGDEF domain-containing protein